MSILIEIFQGLGSIFISLINIYIWVIIISSLLSFVNPDPFNPIVQILYRVTNPAYDLVRRYIPTNIGGIDLAPLVIIVALQVIIVVFSSFLHAL